MKNKYEELKSEEDKKNLPLNVYKEETQPIQCNQQLQLQNDEKALKTYDIKSPEDVNEINSQIEKTEDKNELKKRSPGHQKIFDLFQTILNNKFFFALMVITNVYIIFINPLYPIVFSKSADTVFDILSLICVAIYISEIIMQFICIPHYFLSFYFFIDCLSTILIIFDLTFIYYPLFYKNDDGTNLFAAIRIVKVVRVLRLVRILKLVYTYTEIRGKKVGPKKGESEAQITKILKESNLRKLIVLILVILIAIPFFDISTYTDTPQTGLVYKANFIVPRFLAKHTDFLDNIDELDSLFEQNFVGLIYLRINEKIWDAGIFNSLRPNEWNRVVTTVRFKDVEYDVGLITNVRYQSQITNLLLLLNSLLVTAIMAGSIYSLNKDMSNLVLNPLERMIQKVKEVSRDPLQALRSRSESGNKKGETNETLFIETAINKISQLLVLGFGQAGCKIITYYLVGDNNDLDEKIPGVKVRAIFGFCDIRQFTDATEVLLEDVTAFVNSVAEIVHHSVDSFGGAANKNIGEAFLLVWKLYQEEQISDSLKELTQPGEKLTPALLIQRAQELNSISAEMALLSFIKVIVNINTLPSITGYAQNIPLNERMPGYSVKMGFGLHEGWAIEGAIGSRYKIDASYLSPNVNLASRLEAATKQFKVEILLSGNIFRLFRTPQLRNICRHIDTVTVKGSVRPIKLYTLDLNVEALKSPEMFAYTRNEMHCLKLDKRDSLREKFKELSKRIISNDFKTEEMKKLSRIKTEEEESQVLRTLHRFDFSTILSFEGIDMSTFRMLFRCSVDNYLEGRWTKAKIHFEQCLKLKADDGPTSVIYNYMQNLDFQVPPEWKNCRDLTDK